MAKFHFSMEKILQVKKKLEKQKQLELGKAMQALNEGRLRLESMEVHLYEANEDFKIKIGSGRVHHLEIKSAHERIRYYHESINEQKKEIQSLEAKVEQAKEVLKKALQERKIFESLKEKAYEAYIEQEKIDEAKQLDEIVSYKYRNS